MPIMVGTLAMMDCIPKADTILMMDIMSMVDTIPMVDNLPTLDTILMVHLTLTLILFVLSLAIISYLHKNIGDFHSNGKPQTYIYLTPYP